MLSPTSAANEVPSWPPLSPNGLTPGPVNLDAMHPSIEESNTICQLFFENVNPFLRILHESAFGQALNQYRRGTFILPREFEALLFSIYLLTINNLRPEVVESIFSTSKDALLTRFQQATQTALSNVHFMTSDKIWTLQALLHYLVCKIYIWSISMYFEQHGVHYCIHHYLTPVPDISVSTKPTPRCCGNTRCCGTSSSKHGTSS